MFCCGFFSVRDDGVRCHVPPDWDGAQPDVLAAPLSHAWPAVVLHLGVKCGLPWACSKDKIFKTLLALSEKMLQRSLKRLLSTVIQPCCTKWKLSLTKMDHLNIEVLLSCALCRIFVNKALTCPCRVLNVRFVFIMSLSQSFLRAHFLIHWLEVVLPSFTQGRF